MEKRWFEFFDAYFRKLNKRDIQIWEDELAERFKNYTEDEVITAVKNLAEKKRKGFLQYIPTCNDIITQIKQSRWEWKKSQAGYTTPTKCNACVDGYLWLEGCRAIIPCLCSLGQKTLATKYTEEKHDEMRMLARGVIERQYEIIIAEDRRLLVMLAGRPVLTKDCRDRQNSPSEQNQEPVRAPVTPDGETTDDYGDLPF